jgi:uncharacterized cupin superfamily protein
VKKGERMKNSRNIVHEGEVPWAEFARSHIFHGRRKQLGLASGAQKLGCSLYELPPGACSFPFHYHCTNEEAIYVLEGSGTLRLGDSEIVLRKGHYVSLPCGNAHAHRLDNSSESVLRYLCFSTMIEPEVYVYPDSQKIGLWAEAAPAPKKFFKLDSEVDYFDGEPDA